MTIILCLTIAPQAWAQESPKEYHGKISYITSQNIYVRFDGTNDLLAGDTIFIRIDGSLKPLMLIESKSSYSAIGKPFPTVTVSLGQDVVGRSHRMKTAQAKGETHVSESGLKAVEAVSDSTGREPEESIYKQRIRGRMSLSSHSSFSNATSSDSHRVRYSLSLQAQNINDSRLSLETYANFSYLSSNWAAVQDNVFNALKIYSLALLYQAGDRSDIWLGRKINPNLSNIGAIDGLQFETGVKNFRFGAVVGFRPDYLDYSFNADLLEYGLYAAHQVNTGNGSVRSSLAIFEQTNSGETDRRFLYIQHSNSLLENLFFFLSSEIDLYKTNDGTGQNTFSLTSFYTAVRYRMTRRLWADLSYDNRKNVIYYETFKNLVDQLTDEATRQGVQFRVNYRPADLITLGANTSYRKRESDSRASTSYYGFVSLNQLSKLEATVTLSANVLKTVYLDGSVFGARVYTDLIPGKLSSSLGYRHVDYQFVGAEKSLIQHLSEWDVNWQIARKLSFSVSGETTFEKSDHYNRIYINLTKRF
ncbi:hypothetical protein [Mangrovibacterium lignilyticum]|uniref:hypothetical protein n=1 Tax=Mangrovibacterium lignilyticum TaxID=2668052 RepID=UPI0019671F93|nr:hypothetical protein [Mangrovibacterium lignilyticum]